MTIDTNRCEMNLPHFYSRANESHPMRRIDETIAANSSLLDRFNEQKKSAEDWKAMWLCEVYRGDHGMEETYSVSELDRARQQMPFWDKCTDGNGNITAEYQS